MQILLASNLGIWMESRFPSIDLMGFLTEAPARRAINLRQTIILSSYETPEIRNLFYKSCKNVSGRVSTINTYPGVFNNIKRGVRQVFAKFEAPSAREEDDARFEHFKTKVCLELSVL